MPRNSTFTFAALPLELAWRQLSLITLGSSCLLKSSATNFAQVSEADTKRFGQGIGALVVATDWSQGDVEAGGAIRHKSLWTS